jgi:hypothetical protein
MAATDLLDRRQPDGPVRVGRILRGPVTALIGVIDSGTSGLAGCFGGEARPVTPGVAFLSQGTVMLQPGAAGAPRGAVRRRFRTTPA